MNIYKPFLVPGFAYAAEPDLETGFRGTRLVELDDITFDEMMEDLIQSAYNKARKPNPWRKV